MRTLLAAPVGTLLAAFLSAQEPEDPVAAAREAFEELVRAGGEDEKLLKESQEADRREKELQIQIPSGQRLGDQVIEVKNLRKAFGDKLLIEDLSFSLPPAGIVGIIGPNGAGKTTLAKMLTGLEEPDAGEIIIGKTVDLAYVDQSRDSLDPDKTVYEEITDDYDQLTIGDMLERYFTEPTRQDA